MALIDKYVLAKVLLCFGQCGCILLYPALRQDVTSALVAQTVPIPSDNSPDSVLPPDNLPDSVLPEDLLTPLPSPEELLAPGDGALPPQEDVGDEAATFYVADIQIVGSTVFDDADWADLIEPYRDQQVRFNDLLQLRSEVTQRYVDAGYLTSGALIPPQTIVDDIVTIQVIEGQLEEVVVNGTHRIDQAYVRSRVGLVAQPPLNVEKLLGGLQRLQLDPLIETVSADLQAGVNPGTSVLVIDVVEADSFAVNTGLANTRSPNIGGTQVTLGVDEGNLFGIGDRINLSYKHTEGSDGIDFSYTVPVSPNNDTIRLAAGYSDSRVINSAFSVLDISSDSTYYELGYRHPLVETPTQDAALGLTLSHQSSQTRLGLDDIGPFPLSPGADENGRTRISALRFSQEWTQRSQSHVLALRSQFNLGLDLLDSNISDNAPDSRFFSWRGQGQWVKQLGKPNRLFFLRGDLQLAADDLLSQEEFSLGGGQSVRGYRQDALRRDNGALLSAEVRWPVATVPELGGLLQVTPFIDMGTVWNYNGDNPGQDALVGAGFGLLWQQGDRLSARLDWGIPLVDLDTGEDDGLQDSGIHFSIQYTPF
ncbi:ShlB/FhaC/HecB family hemolysin secretion/activation protein [Leptothoe kymatousa]|uniref:ShlB/FhaC/HecB family hemolysin secretion/activation protein n=1 Tax=Leptothoe kymatousa TAU-MAC 1615 TaxID=2364775 RepID=A0ABS5Y1F0_9CYAN|nr:ShlB/FhaC/HecB family hemolysin secretion/activation protein [Leptothoe kymatousa]MBT9311644.1 ShlB/FhaC/HecB family hemolysin secretion/activation protein [Leptothoe kymatousa TAU-MAC 1615]